MYSIRILPYTSAHYIRAHLFRTQALHKNRGCGKAVEGHPAGDFGSPQGLVSGDVDPAVQSRRAAAVASAPCASSSNTLGYSAVLHFANRYTSVQPTSTATARPHGCSVGQDALGYLASWSYRRLFRRKSKIGPQNCESWFDGADARVCRCQQLKHFRYYVV
jgi:hypothetical protein